MKYSEARNRIGNGDILLFRGKRWYSRLIQLVTISVYSHAGIAHWIKSDGVTRLAVCESLEGAGVRVYPLSEYLRSGVEVDWYSITDESINRDKVVGWAMARWGRNYASPWQLLRSFGLLTRTVCHWLRVPTRIDRDRWFCSWYVTSSLMRGGWQPDPVDEVPAEMVAPGDISRFTCLRRMGPLVWDEDASECREDACRA